jgi:hypothetical protein
VPKILLHLRDELMRITQFKWLPSRDIARRSTTSTTTQHYTLDDIMGCLRPTATTTVKLH